MILDAAFADAALEGTSELRAHLKRTKNPEALAEMPVSSSKAFGFR